MKAPNEVEIFKKRKAPSPKGKTLNIYIIFAPDLFLEFPGIGKSAEDLKAIDFPGAHSAEDAVLEALILPFKACQQLFHILSLGGVILGAGACHHGQRALVGKVQNFLFLGVDHGSDKGDLPV